MRAVLFVDDEPLILSGLRGLLRKERSRWNMAFVASGPAALEALAQQPRDVVVADMRMPGMDGAELLCHIRERYPRTARVILTGQASEEDLIRALPVAQQILSKPCGRSVLCETIERLFKVQALLGNERIQALVGSLERLPLLPKSYHAISQALMREDVSVAEIVRIVEEDPALSTTVLSIANSAYFGRSQPTTSIRLAVSRIGFSLLRALALSTHVFSQVDPSLPSSNKLKDLSASSLLKAQLARQFASDATLKEEAFAAGLLHDIGHIVLAQSCAVSYGGLLELADSAGRPVHEVEQEQLGFTHADVGAYLLGIWGLPARLVELVACHHVPGLLELSDSPVAAAVHVADVLVDAVRAGAHDPLAGIVPSIRARPEVNARLAMWQKMAEQAAGAP